MGGIRLLSKPLVLAEQLQETPRDARIGLPAARAPPTCGSHMCPALGGVGGMGRSQGRMAGGRRRRRAAGVGGGGRSQGRKGREGGGDGGSGGGWGQQHQHAFTQKSMTLKRNQTQPRARRALTCKEVLGRPLPGSPGGHRAWQPPVAATTGSACLPLGPQVSQKACGAIVDSNKGHLGVPATVPASTGPCPDSSLPAS